GSVLPLALVYGLGIVLMFVVIGAVVGAPIQAFATHPVTNLAFAAVFLVFALSLFGLFNLQPPRWMMNLAGQASGKGGFGGVFLMGATLVITSFTCTAPFVGTLIGSAAALGLGWVVLGMAVFGLTMAVPFVLLSLLPGKARALPRGGEWMNTLKVFLGFVEVAAALKFVSNADIIGQWNSLPRELFLWLWAGIFGVAGLYLLGMIRMYGSDGVIGPGRLVGGLATILFAVYCVFGALGSPMDAVMSGIVPNYSAVAADGGNRFAALQPKHTIVRDDHDRAVQLAAAEGKLVLMNLTGFI
ncbi:MAG TPA: cytochrome C biogenesis protein, partial [Planctomycetota bacterium]|nr:cytochrome C biogenesis protein [Planctomycetota bacterium]